MEQVRIGKTVLRLVQGDITRQAVDAIVNAANRHLAGGGGVDGAIHRAGGPVIAEECRAIRERQGGCPPGEAVVTSGGNLPARHVIHAVGPIWQGGAAGEDETLRRAYQNSLRQALACGARTVAFPSISTGAFRFPIDRAAPIALSAIADFVREHPDAFDEVRMVLYSPDDFAAYRHALARLFSASG
ncbi:O-acetyl-ADP-ribose deacetylase [Calditerricola satsumensis]|uniref:O-acetyl-ADP-ribose deacetylase n=2 Tax=Calditerricola satsumensis TaxID=373054 RepID=A0A8J3F9K9_9BACI|nr:O-acetyl-ADP-ribose deacetylase [Calditerricola satsumensis]GGJ93268.1 O-acetyl-ADP-ribose deacetylase [Calditerricola satsumensis]